MSILRLPALRVLKTIPRGTPVPVEPPPRPVTNPGEIERLILDVLADGRRLEHQLVQMNIERMFNARVEDRDIVPVLNSLVSRRMLDFDRMQYFLRGTAPPSRAMVVTRPVFGPTQAQFPVTAPLIPPKREPTLLEQERARLAEIHAPKIQQRVLVEPNLFERNKKQRRLM